MTLLENGEVYAFETLFRLYFDKLVHIARSYQIGEENAKEVVQNVFVKLWFKKRRLSSISNINSYLFLMVKNACLDHIKHEKIKLKYSKEVWDNKSAIQNQFIKDEAAHLLLENELKKKISESIERLPAKCKNVFVKSRLEGIKHQEIADLLGVSKRTVDAHISNALKQMRLDLKDYM
jgi:RNA polymerase sigma-70 factor (ECF subfamily)